MLQQIAKNVYRIARNINKPNVRLTSSIKFYSSSRTYEGDGKTGVDILNSRTDLGILINGISEVGFRLNNDITVLGPIVAFPRAILSWNIKDVNDINFDSLHLFTILEPKLDLVVIGTGDKLKDQSLYSRLLPLMKKYRINLEVLPTEQACSTYNFLCSEGRYVGAALIPPKTLKTSDNDILQSKLRYQSLYELQD